MESHRIESHRVGWKRARAFHAGLRGKSRKVSRGPTGLPAAIRNRPSLGRSRSAATLFKTDTRHQHAEAYRHQHKQERAAPGSDATWCLSPQSCELEGMSAERKTEGGKRRGEMKGCVERWSGERGGEGGGPSQSAHFLCRLPGRSAAALEAVLASAATPRAAAGAGAFTSPLSWPPTPAITADSKASAAG